MTDRINLTPLTLDNARMGLRVRIHNTIDIYPTGIFPAGLEGAVSHVDRERTDPDFIAAHVTLDERRPELDEWENQLQVCTGESGCLLADFEIIDIPFLVEEAREYFDGASHEDCINALYREAERQGLIVENDERFYGMSDEDGIKFVETLYEARTIAARWVARFGLGFHPDTRGTNYEDAAGKRCLTDDEAAEYERDIDRLFAISDPYAAGLGAMRAAGLIEADFPT